MHLWFPGFAKVELVHLKATDLSTAMIFLKENFGQCTHLQVLVLEPSDPSPPPISSCLFANSSHLEQSPTCPVSTCMLSLDDSKMRSHDKSSSESGFFHIDGVLGVLHIVLAYI